MKPPTYTELLTLQSCVLSCRSPLPVTARQHDMILGLIRDALAVAKQDCRYTISIPGLKAGPWYFRTRGEGEKRRRWLIQNIDLTRKAKVVPYKP